MSDRMRVAIGQFNELTNERLRFAKQIGASGVLLNTPLLPGESVWDERDLRNLRLRAEEWGLRLEAIENVPLRFYDKAMLGLPGRDEQIDNYRSIIRAFGRAGIPILGYHFMPNGVWRTPPGQGRGGARVTRFELALARDAPLSHGREFGAEEMWASYAYFIKAVLPIAEESGVTLALHPDDPPVPSLGGVARLFGGLEGFRRAVEEIAPSPNHGLDFCMGCWSEMGPGAIPPMQYFAERGKIVYVHFRDVQGVVPTFAECFLGEGNTDVVAAMLTLKRAGFHGFIIDDHVPHLVDDTEWGHRGRCHQTGYIMGLLAAVERLG